MRRPGTAVGRALAVCVAVTALLTGCGVQQTDVIEVGGPATVSVYPFPEQRMLLFFLSSEGRPAPVSRQVRTDADVKAGMGPVDGQKVMTLLFEGPMPHEREAGLRTGLPRLGKKGVVVKSSRDVVDVVLPFDVRSLGESALRQVVCTAAYVDGGDGVAKVRVVGDDGTLPSSYC
ncbi:hypothetical protein ABZ614_00515 [Streptomyces sp. NPDC013178]|uniref:hypothetical protein n=1 Tax=unclassified Streptomyces TaxID=2593676 RepID=UPI0033CA7D6E